MDFENAILAVLASVPLVVMLTIAFQPLGPVHSNGLSKEIILKMLFAPCHAGFSAVVFQPSGFVHSTLKDGLSSFVKSQPSFRYITSHSSGARYARPLNSSVRDFNQKEEPHLLFRTYLMFIFTAPITSYAVIAFMDCLKRCDVTSVVAFFPFTLLFSIPLSLLFGAVYAILFKISYGIIKLDVLRFMLLGPMLGGLVGVSFVLILNQGFGTISKPYFMAFTAGAISGCMCYAVAKNP